MTPQRSVRVWAGRAAAVALLLTLAGCTAPGTPRATARATLAAIALPPQATPLHGAPAGRLRVPATREACTPLSTATGFWSVRGLSIDAAQRFFEHHAPHGFTVASTGTGAFGDAAPQTEVTFAASGHTDRLLDVVAEATQDGVDLRADAEVAPPGASCLRS